MSMSVISIRNRQIRSKRKSPMSDAKKVEKAAQKVVSPLNKIAGWKYESPWVEKETSRPTIAVSKHKSDFETLQKTAKGTAVTLGKAAAVVIKDQKVIQGNVDSLNKTFQDYEKPFQAQQNTSKISGLLMEVNAVVAYWHQVVKEIG
jgi:hypothetical protein